MAKENGSDVQKMGVLFEADRRISAEYRCASSILQEKEVAQKFKFLGALDRLAKKHDLSARDIIKLLKPGYFDTQNQEGANIKIKELHDILVRKIEKQE